MKKRTILFAFLLVFGASLRAQPPDVQTIVDGYVDAIGGADAWLKLNSMEMKGKMSMQGVEIPFTITTAKGDKSYQVMEIQDQKVIQAYDGETAWTVAPFMDIGFVIYFWW
jgi:hypothetical protein